MTDKYGHEWNGYKCERCGVTKESLNAMRACLGYREVEDYSPSTFLDNPAPSFSMPSLDSTPASDPAPSYDSTPSSDSSPSFSDTAFSGGDSGGGGGGSDY